MAYADQGISRNRVIAIGVVAFIHVVLGYAFITGLALKAVKSAINKIEAVNVKDKVVKPDEPPPPPPKDIEIPPYVPPPEVSITQDAAPVITTTSVAPPPEPPRFTPPAPPAPPAPVAVAAPTQAIPRGRGNVISEDDYPDASRRAEEQGVTRVSYVIAASGQVSDCQVTKSSGFPRLDEATCRIILRRFRFSPATREGQPIAETRPQSVKWQLTDSR